MYSYRSRGSDASPIGSMHSELFVSPLESGDDESTVSSWTAVILLYRIKSRSEIVKCHGRPAPRYSYLMPDGGGMGKKDPVLPMHISEAKTAIPLSACRYFPARVVTISRWGPNAHSADMLLCWPQY